MISRFYLSTLILFFCYATLKSQSAPTGTLHLKGLHFDNNIWLRWVPSDYDTWVWGNQHGYKVERYTVRRQADYLSPKDMADTREELVSGLLPEPESSWATKPDSNLAGIVASMLYADSLEIMDWGNAGIGDIVGAQENRQTRFSFGLFACDQNFEIALAAALGWPDPNLQPDCEYLYVVSLLGSDIKAVCILNTSEATQVPVPPKPKAIGGDHQAFLYWEKTEQSEFYSTYSIERSADNGQTWAAVNQAPFLAASDKSSDKSGGYLDSLPDNNTIFTYRIAGRSPFGILGPWSDTAQVKGIPPPLVEPPQIQQCTEPVTGNMQVSWTFPSAQESSLTRFELFRASRIDGEYRFVGHVAPTVRQATDYNPGPANYYMIKAKDINGVYVPSLPHLGQLKDETPPAAPVQLHGTCDLSGLVTVKWRPNTEPDIYAYQVFSSDQRGADSTFVQITGGPLQDTVFRFRTQVQTLTRKLYVYVKALDFHENPSAPSVRLEITRPDVVPPVPPVIGKVSPTPDAVVFEVQPSPSDDVVRYVFQKREEGQPAWSNWATYGANDLPKICIDSLSFVGNGVAKRRWYQYRLMAYDAANNAGGSKPIRSKPLDLGLRDSIRNLTYQHVGTAPQPTLNSSIALQWDYAQDPDLVGFQIFRAVDTSKTRSYKFISVNDAQDVRNPGGHWIFLDTDLDMRNLQARTLYVGFGPSGSYTAPGAINKTNTSANHGAFVLRYQVAAVYFDGAQSPLSQEIQILVQ